MGSFAPIAPFAFIVAIVWLNLHYKHKYRNDPEHGRKPRQRRWQRRWSEGDSATEEEPAATPASAEPDPGYADLIRIAERMEQRLAALEQLLDTQAPGWRTRHD